MKKEFEKTESESAESLRNNKKQTTKITVL